MARRRCTCDIPNCDGIECYLADPADTPDDEIAAPRAPYVASPEYLAWCEKIDGDPLRHIEPRARRVA